MTDAGALPGASPRPLNTADTRYARHAKRAEGASLAALTGEAFSNLRGHARRSLLALLGVVIGSAAIIALLNLGHIAQVETLKRFEQMGVDMLQVRASPAGNSGETPLLDRAAVEALALTDPEVIEAVPLAMGREPVRLGGLSANATILAAPPALFALAGLNPVRGRGLVAVDECGLVAVAGAGLARDLSTPAAPLAPGARVLVGDYGYTIVGVLPEMMLQTLNPADYNTTLIIPLSCAQRVLESGRPSSALVRLQPEADPSAVGARISQALITPSARPNVRSARELIEAMNRQKAVFANLLAGIGAISLLVGGVGVLNVMLMTVMERRREIGLRAALGATPADIRRLFLIEAAMLSIAGGALGAIVGVASTALIGTLSGWGFAIAFWVLPLGPGMAGVIGVLFGAYPAVAASRIDPIEALRAD